MHIIQKLRIGKDCPVNVTDNRDKFVTQLKEVTAKRLELREEDTQEVIFYDYPTHPQIIYGEKTYFMVGCKKCENGHGWSIYYDGKEFVAKCSCGNTIELSKVDVQDKPENKPIPLRNII